MSALEIILIVIALGSLGFVFLAMFTALGDGPRDLKTTDTLKLQGDHFFSTLEGALHTTFESGGEATIVNNGDGFFPALQTAIADAKQSINIMVFIWMRGPLGDGLLEALTARAKAGVEVRLLLDALGCALVNREKVNELRAAGGQVVFFRPLRFGIIHRFHRRNHSRSFVFDGLTGFTGGMAIEGRWQGNADKPENWRDMMIKTTGHMTAGLQNSFATMWANTTGEMLVGEKFFPTLPKVEEPKWVTIMSAPSFESHPARKVFAISCAAAQKSICIRNSYFVPGGIVCKILTEQAKAGIDVRVIVPNYRNDQKLAYYAGRYFYDTLMTAGVKIFEYQPTMIHSKTMLVDDTWSIFGSANLDIRSHELNIENMLGIFDHKLGTEHRTDFNVDLANSRQLDLTTWRQRPLHQKLLEYLCLLFAQQL